MRCFKYRRVSLSVFAPTALAAALAVLCLPASGLADEYHYNDVFMSPRSAGLAGTMIGLADDPSTAWYNPAGLYRRSEMTITVNATALIARQLSLTNSAFDRPINYTSAAAFSPSAITTMRVGPGNLAMMVLEPDNDSYYLDETFEYPDEQLEARMVTESESSSYLIGLSYGAAIGRGLALGIGIGYIYETDSSRTSIYALSRSEDSGLIYGSQLDNSVNSVRHGLLILAGLLWSPMGEEGPLTIGLKFQTGVNVSNSASTQVTLWDGVSVGDSEEIIYKRVAPEVENRTGMTRQPPMLGVGAAWRITRNWVVAADLTLHGYVSYDSFGEKIRKLSTVNGSVASELSLSDGIIFRAGAFTNRSSAPKDSSTASLNIWDEYGATLGASFQRGNYDYTVALKFSWLTGKQELPEDADETATANKISGRNVGIVFGGTYKF